MFSGANLPVTVADVTVFNIVIAVYNRASTRIIANGTVASGDVGGNDRTEFRLSGYGGGGFHLNGDIAEAGQYTGEPSDVDINRLGNHLADKYDRSWADI